MNNLVILNKENIYTESQVVAEIFKKDHKNLLRDIRNLNCSEEFLRLNFEPSTYKLKGKLYPNYHITKDGFTFLGMGFNGKKYIPFKELYIQKFNEMEKMLIQQKLLRFECHQLTDNIKSIHEEPQFYHYSNEMNMINKIVLGMQAKKFRELHGLEKGQSIRPHLTPKQIKDIELLQHVDVGFVIAIPDFEDRKKALEKYYETRNRLQLKDNLDG